MGFVADNLFNGRRIRGLTVVDNFSRQCLANRLRGEDFVAAMERLKPRVLVRLQTDNSSEFISKSLDRWAYENKVTIDYGLERPQTILWSSHLMTAFVINV